MPSALETIFWGIVTLSIVVVLHEGGHFVAAKLFGLRVHEFMLGLPGPKLSFRWRGTLFGVTAIPLGGYVKIAGMSGDQSNRLIEPALGLLTARGPLTTEQVDEHFSQSDDDSVMALVTLQDWGVVTYDRKSDLWASNFEPADVEREGGIALVADNARKNTFGTLSLWKRLAILVAGVAVNIVIAFAVFAGVLALWGTPVEQPFVGVVAGYPAAEAGVRDGDIPVAVDGVPVSGFDDLIAAVGSHQVGEKVDLTVERGGQQVTLQVGTVLNPDTDRPMLGLERQFENQPMPVASAIKMSTGFVAQTGRMVFSLLSPSRAGETVAQSSSVVGISVVAAQAAERSALDYATIVASLSLSLGLINILPVPPLDGGRVVLALWEAVTRRRIPSGVATAISAVGIVALISLMVITMFNDVSRLVG